MNLTKPDFRHAPKHAASSIAILCCIVSQTAPASAAETTFSVPDGVLTVHSVNRIDPAFVSPDPNTSHAVEIVYSLDNPSKYRLVPTRNAGLAGQGFSRDHTHVGRYLVREDDDDIPLTYGVDSPSSASFSVRMGGRPACSIEDTATNIAIPFNFGTVSLLALRRMGQNSGWWKPTGQALSCTLPEGIEPPAGKDHDGIQLLLIEDFSYNRPAGLSKPTVEVDGASRSNGVGINSGRTLKSYQLSDSGSDTTSLQISATSPKSEVVATWNLEDATLASAANIAIQDLKVTSNSLALIYTANPPKDRELRLAFTDAQGTELAALSLESTESSSAGGGIGVDTNLVKKLVLHSHPVKTIKVNGISLRPRSEPQDVTIEGGRAKTAP